MNVFEAVRESGITTRQAAERCGIKINRNGMAVCPFHNDNNVNAGYCYHLFWENQKILKKQFNL